MAQAEAHKPHLLRGETADSHVWTLDRLTTDGVALTAGDVHVRAMGRGLQVQLHGVMHQWELPIDTDLTGSYQGTLDPAGGKLTLTFAKKPHGDTPEDLQRLRMESMAENICTDWWPIHTV